MSKHTRRQALKGLGIATAAGTIAASASNAAQAEADNRSDWHTLPDRVWIGPEFWANPMEDWAIENSSLICRSSQPGRNIHWISKRLDVRQGDFTTQVQVQEVDDKQANGSVGFRLGVRSDIDEHRSNAFARGGVEAGYRDGRLFIGGKRQEVEIDLKKRTLLKVNSVGGGSDSKEVELTLVAMQGGTEVGKVVSKLGAGKLVGNIALAHNFSKAGRGNKKVNADRARLYRFESWSCDGAGVQHRSNQAFGPLLWAMYTLSDSRSAAGFVLKLAALTGPLGNGDNKEVQLQYRRGGGAWSEPLTASLDTDAWVANFKIDNWDASQDAQYRLTYVQRRVGLEDTTSTFEGHIQANPTGRPLRMAALTCQNHYGFPYEPVAENVKQLAPDLVYFSGDQLYESHGGFGIIREPADRAILNYLRKFYMFGWAFRDVMRDAPTVCIPDDHDVFQGNIWGEGGAPMKDISAGASSKGGYREPARMVNVVHKTNASHHPDPFDPAPVQQGISVYYGELVYGDVGFAILSDRQFKSGPERVETGSGRADHVRDPAFDTSKLDRDSLVLLGDRQEQFLRSWAEDWRGHTLKCILSQTVFAGVATHHGKYDGFLKADLDSGGWPQTARNRAIEILRPAKALHVNGDQHLTSLCQYGIQTQRDAFWSFCTPAIAAGYPRWWRPDELKMSHENRPSHGLANTGEFQDGFGNLVYVYSVGNPEIGSKKNRYELAHQKGSGFGFVTFDTSAKTYLVESFRFLCDPSGDASKSQFPGWPVTIAQRENGGENTLS
ncbi:MAG TPA: twin-arginine translocation pathway signal [Planctomycetaceae bacterium]|nr:twin-arginine translocation pathway signal [Planctomycetaceae bacterium]